MIRSAGIEAFAQAWGSQPVFSAQSREVRRVLDEVRRGQEAEGLARCLEVLGLAEMPDCRSVFSSGLPVLYIVGEHDAKFRDLAGELGALTEVVKACGHNVLAENPEAVAALVGSFTRDVDAKPPGRGTSA